MPSRREALTHAARVAALLAGAGLLPNSAQAAWNAAAFDADTLKDVVKLLGGGAPVASREVSIVGPDIAENGAQVQLTLGTTLPGVKRLVLLVEKNPNMLSAVFEPSEAVEPSLTLRVKMNESSNVYAVALLADGRALFAQREVRVTLSGCAA